MGRPKKTQPVKLTPAQQETVKLAIDSIGEAVTVACRVTQLLTDTDPDRFERSCVLLDCVADRIKTANIEVRSIRSALAPDPPERFPSEMPLPQRNPNGVPREAYIDPSIAVLSPEEIEAHPLLTREHKDALQKTFRTTSAPLVHPEPETVRVTDNETGEVSKVSKPFKDRTSESIGQSPNAELIRGPMVTRGDVAPNIDIDYDEGSPE